MGIESLEDWSVKVVKGGDNGGEGVNGVKEWGDGGLKKIRMEVM